MMEQKIIRLNIFVNYLNSELQFFAGHAKHPFDIVFGEQEAALLVTDVDRHLRADGACRVTDFLAVD